MRIKVGEKVFGRLFDGGLCRPGRVVGILVEVLPEPDVYGRKFAVKDEYGRRFLCVKVMRF